MDKYIGYWVLKVRCTQDILINFFHMPLINIDVQNHSILSKWFRRCNYIHVEPNLVEFARLCGESKHKVCEPLWPLFLIKHLVAYGKDGNWVRTPKDTCYNEIGHCDVNIEIPYINSQHNWKSLYACSKRTIFFFFTLSSNSFCISIPIIKLEVSIFLIHNH